MTDTQRMEALLREFFKPTSTGAGEMTKDQYLKDVMHMLFHMEGDYHIGRNQREIIAMCAELKRPVANCVSLLIRLSTGSTD